MKIYICLFCIVFMLAASHLTSAQSFTTPLRLEIGTNKTTNLIFPSPISSVDRGSASVLAQKAAGAQHILQIKASSKGFSETNLTVITTNGNLYSFMLNYADTPAHLNVYIPDSIAAAPNAWETLSQKIRQEKNTIRYLRYQDASISVIVEGFYIMDSWLFCKIKLKNYTSIHCDIDQYRFYVKDRYEPVGYRVEAQAIEPIYISGDRTQIKANSAQTMILVLPKISIPDQKYLLLQVSEKEGGYCRKIHIRSRYIAHAKSL